ncbi:MAG: hypothetical protein ABSB79_14905 [Syntrophales bacterium]|jgi:hypothetical protein
MIDMKTRVPIIVFFLVLCFAISVPFAKDVYILSGQTYFLIAAMNFALPV